MAKFRLSHHALELKVQSVILGKPSVDYSKTGASLPLVTNPSDVRPCQTCHY